MSRQAEPDEREGARGLDAPGVGWRASEARNGRREARPSRPSYLTIDMDSDPGPRLRDEGSLARQESAEEAGGRGCGARNQGKILVPHRISEAVGVEKGR